MYCILHVLYPLGSLKYEETKLGALVVINDSVELYVPANVIKCQTK